MLTRFAIAAALVWAGSGNCLADITVGVTLSATGPASSLGLPEKNTIGLLPRQIGGETVSYVVLDDASDTTTAVRNVRKLTRYEHVDVVIGSTISSNSLAILDLASESKTPIISLSAAARIVAPVDEKRRWLFKTPQNDSLMAAAIAEHMAAHGVKSVAYIGTADAYGEGWWTEFSKAVESRGIRLVANERFGRSDKATAAQVARIQAQNPDAVLIGAAGVPASVPQVALRDTHYTGPIYQSHGAANNDYIKAAGKSIDGTVLPVGPVLVAAQLPESHPSKKAAMDYVARYEAVNGKGSVSAFGAHAWDAGLLLQAAVPVALRAAKPGTEAFRVALRDALEQERSVAGAHGVFSLNAQDHAGLDQRARVMVTVENGRWKMLR